MRAVFAGVFLLFTLASVPAQGGGWGQIAFSCGDAVGNQQVCLLDLPAQHIRQLTFGPSHALASWSPDGSELTVTRVVDETHTVVIVMDADGSNPRGIADYGFNSTWSSAGEIAYAKTRGNGRCGTSIWVINPDGTDDRQVTCAGSTHDHVSPAWSPDGTQIAYIESSPVGGTGLLLAGWVVGVDGTGPTRITWPGNVNVDDDGATINTAESVDALNWSVANDRIVFWSGVTVPPFGQVWTMNADGSDRQQLTHEAGWNHDDPSWSPDGRYILFTRGDPTNRDISSELWIMGADGGTPVSLVPLRTGPLPGHSAWRPTPHRQGQPSIPPGKGVIKNLDR